MSIEIVNPSLYLHHDVVFPQGQNAFFRRMLVSGSSLTGKTHMVCHRLLPLMCLPNNLFIFSPNYGQDCFNQIANLYKKIKTHVYRSDNLNDIEDLIFNKETSVIKNGHINNIVIIDDFLERKELTNPFVKALFSRGRHKNISVILITQNQVEVPPTIKKNLTDTFIFSYTTDIIPIYRDCSRYFEDIHQFRELYNYSVSSPFSFMWICMDPFLENEDLRVRKGFYEPLIKKHVVVCS
jgi:hypothetical protein